MYNRIRKIDKRHIQNASWPVFETTLPPLLMLVFVPVFMRFLGAEKYGIWILVNSIAAFVGFLNVGFGDVNIKYISRYKALNDSAQVRSVVYAIYSLSLFSLAGGVLLGAVVSLFTGFLGAHFDWARKLADYSDLIVLGFAIFSLKVVEQSFLAVFKGFERYDLSSKLGVLSKSLPIFANILVAYYTRSLFTVFLSSVIISAVFLVIDYLIIRYRFVRFPFVPGINSAVLREVMGFGFWSFLQGVIGVLAAQIDKLLVAKLAGVKVLAYYSIAQMVGGQIHAIFSSASGFIFPIISKKVELKEPLEHVYNKMQLFIVAFGLAAVLAVFFFREPIFFIWLGYDGYSNVIKFAEIFLLLELFVLPTIVAYYYLNAGGFIRLNTRLMALSLLLQMFLMTLFFHWGGVYGLAIGKAAAVLLVAILSVSVVYLRVLKKKNSFKYICLTFIPGILALFYYCFFGV